MKRRCTNNEAALHQAQAVPLSFSPLADVVSLSLIVDEAMRQILGWFHTTLGRSRLMTRAAVRVRNQCHSIIRSHLAQGPDGTKNGEFAFLKTFASMREEPFVFFDIGANVGDWTAMALHTGKAAQGVLFDPSAAACAALRMRFSGSPVDIVEMAVSDAEGQAVFYQEPEAGTHSSLVHSFARVGAEQRTVRITTVDREARARGLERIDFMKVDCEGYDFHVLRGARQLLAEQRVGVVQFEYNAPWADAGSTLAAALRFLTEHGYEVFLLKAAGLYRFRYEEYGEFLDYANFVALPRGSAESLVRGTI